MRGLDTLSTATVLYSVQYCLPNWFLSIRIAESNPHHMAASTCVVILQGLTLAHGLEMR